MTLEQRRYRDPAIVVEEDQNRSCHGCKFKRSMFDRPVCIKGRVVGRKCKQFKEQGK